MHSSPYKVAWWKLHCNLCTRKTAVQLWTLKRVNFNKTLYFSKRNIFVEYVLTAITDVSFFYNSSWVHRVDFFPFHAISQEVKSVGQIYDVLCIISWSQKYFVMLILTGLKKLCHQMIFHLLTDEEENTVGTGERMEGSNTRNQCLFFITFILTLIISLALVSFVIFLIRK